MYKPIGILIGATVVALLGAFCMRVFEVYTTGQEWLIWAVIQFVFLVICGLFFQSVNYSTVGAIVHCLFVDALSAFYEIKPTIKFQLIAAGIYILVALFLILIVWSKTHSKHDVGQSL